MKRTFFALALLIMPSTLVAADYFPPPDAQGGWRTLKNDQELRKTAGVDRKKLDMAFEYVSRTSQHGGLLVVRHGYLVFEKYYGRGNREATPTMASIGKAFTSISCGIMMEEKKAKIPRGLETKVFTQEFLPEAFPLDDPRKSDITLGQLLSMAGGLHGEGANPGFVNFEPAVKLEPVPRNAALAGNPEAQDQGAVHTPLWTNPGEGYSYASNSPHIASMVLRRLTGMEMQQYIDEKLAKPMGWGIWGYGLHNGATTLPHTPGGGNIAARATDTVRFGYMLLHQGRWGAQQLVPASYVAACGRPATYQKHAPFSLMFEVNADGHVAGAPRDAYFKSGAGGSGIVVIPSLDLVIYKMAGNDQQFDPAATGLPVKYSYDGSRDHWKPGAHTQFNDGPIGGDDGLRRTIEMVVAAVEN